MRPFEVKAGEWAPDVDAALEKAKDMLKGIERDDSAIRNVRGVEETQAAHYWTNQQLPETDIESVSKKASSAENVNLIDGNPHQTGSSLAMHENNSGGNAQPSSLTKSILKTLGGTCPDCGKKLEKAGAMCKEVACGESMSKGPLDALMGGGGPPGEGPMDDMDEGPEAGPLDDDDPEDLANRIKDLVDQLAEKNGGKPDMPDMDDGPPMPDMGDDKPPMP